MSVAVARHHALLRVAIEAIHGQVFNIAGDAFCSAFATANYALAAALAAQRALSHSDWGPTPIRVRMGLHTGEAEAASGDYRSGPTLNRVARVMSIAYGGQILLSEITAGLLRRQLPDGIILRDMGEHRLKGLADLERILQVVAPDLPSEFPPLKSLSIVPNNLPLQLTSFIGREAEIAQVQRLLTTTRLLTLTGSGGTGKTRLSLEVAAGLFDRFHDGVWFVELASVVDPEFVPQTVASALSVREQPGRPIQATLTDYVRDKHLLIILDNCEHLIAACAQFADTLLHAAPFVRILASSREALGIGGEAAYHLPSLPIPNLKVTFSLAELAAYDAVRLFVERAQAAKSSFTLSAANSLAVAQICYRLDGIPLAIELAAARIRVFSAEQIAARLDDRFRLLTGGSRTALPRQQTLRALIDWSYDLLSVLERILLRRLSVFAGSWTFEAAEAICAGDEIETSEVLDSLTRLVEKSLVVVDEKYGETRYRMLETIRQYARDMLLASNEGEAIRGRHLVYFAHIAAEARPKLEGIDQARWLERFESEHDNLRAAIEWSFHDRNPTLQLELPAAMATFWYTHGYHTEAEETLKRALATTEGRAETPQVTRARMPAIFALTSLLWGQGRFAEAMPLTEEGVVLAERDGSLAIRARAYRWRGVIASHQGDYSVSHAWLIRSLEADAASEVSTDKNWRPWILWSLGDDAYLQSDYARAQLYYAECAAIFKARGHKNGRTYPLRRLGYIAIHQGDLDTARICIAESLADNWELMERKGIIGCLAAQASLETARGQWIRAATLFGCVASLLKSMHTTLHPIDQLEYERNAAIARNQLEAAQLDSAWNAGQALDLEQAIRYAQRDKS